jgi:general secretion pathway protein H
MAGTASIKTLLKTISTSLKSRPRDLRESGFTLFEILIVVTIIAGLMSVLLQTPNRKESLAKKTSRHLLVLSKDVRNQARLKNRTFRIVFRMEGDEHSYWVESADGIALPKTAQQLEDEGRLSEDLRPKENFQKEQKFTKTQYSLGKSLFFGGIELQNARDTTTEGDAYIYYSPQGLVQGSAIHLTDKKDLNWTLFINPLTGKVDIVAKKLSLKDIQRE